MDSRLGTLEMGQEVIGAASTAAQSFNAPRNPCLKYIDGREARSTPLDPPTNRRPLDFPALKLASRAGALRISLEGIPLQG